MRDHACDQVCDRHWSPEALGHRNGGSVSEAPQPRGYDQGMGLPIRGAVLKEARLRAGMTQHDLAIKVGLRAGGSSKISMYESGRTQPHTPSRLSSLADAVGLDIRDLLVMPAGGPGLRWLRFAAGLEPADLAAAAGVTPATIRRWESQALVEPSQVNLEALASVLDVPADEVAAAITTQA